MSRHPASCKACKASVEVLLRARYGNAERNWASRWPCRVTDLAGSPSGSALAAIHASLVSHRGFTHFVRSRRLPPCDYFVPAAAGRRGFLVEYDEGQHFTAPRAIALAGLPANLAVSFDVARWRDLALSLNRHDKDPEFRDEQRAWYDILRDVLPAENGLGPTSRLLDREVAYCMLDPNEAADQATFEKMLNRPNHSGA